MNKGDLVNENLMTRLFGAGAEPPGWGVVLGSGFSSWEDRFQVKGSASFEDMEGLSGTSVPGHRGRFLGGSVGGVSVAVCSGRLHLYEGHSAGQVVSPIRILLEMGVKNLMLTTASGGVDKGLNRGEAVVVSDHINLTGADPHTATGAFVNPSKVYDPEYVEFFRQRGIRSGVLAGVRGPSYETPAEVRALSIMGADVVSMSTVTEALFAAGFGVRTACISVVANSAGHQGTTHAGVLDAVSRTVDGIWPVVEELIVLGEGRPSS